MILSICCYLSLNLKQVRGLGDARCEISFASRCERSFRNEPEDPGGAASCRICAETSALAVRGRPNMTLALAHWVQVICEEFIGLAALSRLDAHYPTPQLQDDVGSRRFPYGDDALL